ncbi:MAG: hypothetical protein QY332_08770 [Anaerolineales bacterium]|nr:MAG: hypothetical protein QY332_08770 [Anaerolineales bacterium]
MKRTFPVTLALWLVLILTMWNLLRAWTALAWSGVLTEFSAGLTPALGAVIGGLWVTIGIVLCWGMWQKKAWSVKLLLGTAAAYTVWYWSERFLFQYPRPNLVFAVIVNLGLLVLIFFAVKSMSREAYEQTI